MQQQRLILDGQLLDITVSRLCYELIERHEEAFAETVFLGLQPRGIYLAERIKARLQEITGSPVPLGYLDTTFHRDDFRRRPQPIRANATHVPFIIEDKKVVLIDDVLYTGRSIRAALEAMVTFGRPRKVELLVLIDRKYSRHLPVAPDYVGRSVNTLQSQRVVVELREQGHPTDNIWLKEKEAL